jgi:small-conductance mechanosensitive channel
MYSSRMKWSVGSLVFLLPGLVGLVGDYLERLPAINSRESASVVLFVFSISVLSAVVVPAVFIMAAPATLTRRLAFTGAVWCLLFLEIWVIYVCSLRGVH